MKFFDRFNSNNKFLKYLYYLIIIVIFIFLIFSCQKNYKIVKRYRYDTINKYKRNISELITEIDEMGDNLYKVYLSTDYGQTAKTVLGISYDSSFAACALNDLPSEEGVLENCVKFVNQVGDYAASSALKVLDEKNLTVEERQEFLKFAKYSESLLESLVELSDNINAGRTDLSVFANEKYKENPFKDVYTNINDNFCDYNSPKYDGKYSGSLVKPVDYTGFMMVSPEDAVKKINDKLNQNIVDYDIDESESNVLGKVYNVNFKNQNGYNSYAAVTANGGILHNYNSERVPDSTSYDIDDSIRVCEEFVKNNGFSEINIFEYEIKENIAVIFLSNKENNIIYYPSTVEIKVALDNLEILYVDFTKYLSMLNNTAVKTFNHTDKEIQNKLSEYKVISINKALISNDYKYNLCVYEVTIKIEDKTFLIYLNGENLKQEGICIVTEDEFSRYVH